MSMELNFSIIGEMTPVLSDLLHQFEARQGITVKVWGMDWDTAWQELVSYALHGKGPDVSQVGSTWSSSLVTMNTLRPFAPGEVAGGAKNLAANFLPACWASTSLPGDRTIWSLPWSAYVYLIYYRRELLERAGIQEKDAFVDGGALLDTVMRLKDAGNSSPLVLPSGFNYLDRVHIASSWIWGVGGELVREDGRQVLFNQPQARQGLKAFFSLYHALNPSDRYLSYDECLERFGEGKTAMTIAGIELAMNILNASDKSELQQNLGIATLPGTPWVGGDNLVIWKETRFHPGREQAALALVNFLISRSAQIQYCQDLAQLPTRVDVLQDVPDAPPAIRDAITRSLLIGRSHLEVSLWGRIEIQLGKALDDITASIMADPQADLEAIFTAHLELAERRLNLMLS